MVVSCHKIETAIKIKVKTKPDIGAASIQQRAIISTHIHAHTDTLRLRDNLIHDAHVIMSEISLVVNRDVRVVSGKQVSR